MDRAREGPVTPMFRSDTTGIHRPSRDRIADLGSSLGLSLNEQELEDYEAILHATFDALEGINGFARPQFGPDERSHTDRPPGWRPDPEDNPCNTWITRCRVEGAEDGPLAGMEVGLKDNIALAGYELTCGSRVLEGFVPQIDATVATRLLEAGATITGKLNMESFAFSGTGDTSDFGPVTNPRDNDFLAGGSSSGSGAAPALGEVDVAIGGDQAGSIRIPSAWCGIVGLKPTRGLVPYTGIVPLEMSLDHVGPMATSVADVAAVLAVIAGEDTYDGVKMDPRQPRGVEAKEYTEALGVDIDGYSVGVLQEGFGWDFSHPEVDETVREAIGELENLGVEAEPVNMELHRASILIADALFLHGAYRLLQESGTGTNHPGWQWPGLVEILGKVKDARADDFPPTIKRALLAGEHLFDQNNLSYYVRGRNLALEAERRYNKLLAEYDALVMPTMAFPPVELDDELDRVEQMDREPPIIANTCLFDFTGHPAITVPCGTADGLPVGLMLVGSHFEESTLLSLADAFESAVNWQER